MILHEDVFSSFVSIPWVCLFYFLFVYIFIKPCVYVLPKKDKT